MSGVFGSGTHSCADSCLYINWTLLNPERLSVPKKSDRHGSATRLRSVGNGTDAGVLQTVPPTTSPPASFLHIVLLCLHLPFSLGFCLFLLLPARLLPGAQLALSCLIAWNRLGVRRGDDDAETTTAQCIMHYTCVCVFPWCDRSVFSFGSKRWVSTSNMVVVKSEGEKVKDT